MTEAQSAPQFSTAEFEPELLDSHAHFMRGLLFGAGGAIVGLALYAAVVIITDYEIGFASLAVGWIVAKAILAGSRGRTGRRYQIAAALLTYFAVSMSTVPVVIAQVIKLNRTIEASAKTGTTAVNPSPGTGAATIPATPNEENVEPISFASLAGTLLWLGVSSPFLGLQNMPGGLIGLIILGVGIQIAWKMTGGTRLPIEQTIAGAPAEDEKPTSLNIGR